MATWRAASARCAALAAIAYLAVAVWNFRSVLPDPKALLPANGQLDENLTRIGRLDQAMVVSVVTRNAERILTRPLRLRGDGQCHPLPHSYTLGEHMFGVGLLAALPYLTTGDPILAYNLTLILTVWIPALTMYALAFHFTRSPPAAFTAGLLFALDPARISDGGHPFIHGDLWTPLALLFVHRLFAAGGLWDALGVAVFVGLEALESLYPLVGCAILVGVYGASCALRYPRRLPRIVLPLLLCIACVATVVWLVLGPYLETRDRYGVLTRAGTVFMPLAAYAPGQFAFPGWLLVAGVVIALADRLRGARPVMGQDPRLAFFLAGLCVMWASVRSIPVPFVPSLELASPLLLAKQIIPGLDSVRAMASVGRGAVLAFAFLSAYAVLALGDRVGRRGRIAIAAVASLAIVAERFMPALATFNFGGALDLVSYQARPPEEDVALITAHAEGGLLDVPLPSGKNELQDWRMAQHLLLTSFSPRPTAACYNSFPSPLQSQVASLANRLPDARASDALVSLGFGTVVVHTDLLWPAALQRFTQALTNDPANAERLSPLGSTDRLTLYRLASSTPIRRSFDLLSAASEEQPTVTASPPETAIPFLFVNRGTETFRHPDPIAPSDLVVRWLPESGTGPTEWRTRGMLPIALGAGTGTKLELKIPVPSVDGSYTVEVSLASKPENVLARRSVRVEPRTGGAETS